MIRKPARSSKPAPAEIPAGRRACIWRARLAVGFSLGLFFAGGPGGLDPVAQSRPAAPPSAQSAFSPAERARAASLITEILRVYEAALSDSILGLASPDSRRSSDLRLRELVENLAALSARAPHSPERYFARALQEKRYLAPERAVELLDRALAANPGFAPARLFRAEIKNFDLGDAAGAEQDLNALLAANPRQSLALLLRALLAAHAGRLADAARDAHALAELDPQHRAARFLRGYYRLNAGQIQAGCEDLRRLAAQGVAPAEDLVKSACQNP